MIGRRNSHFPKSRQGGRVSGVGRAKPGDRASRQNRDIFVRQAQARGLRARSAFKLEQIDRKYHLIKPATRIVDLGCAPGGWSQYAASRISPDNRIVGVDLLPMEKLEKVHFIQGDFTDPSIWHTASQFFADCAIDLVLSDMAPNITGIRITDQANVEKLHFSILGFCKDNLRRGGNLVAKVFEGETFNSIRQRFKACFDGVQTVKPAASRSQSREIYLVARGFRPHNSD